MEPSTLKNLSSALASSLQGSMYLPGHEGYASEIATFNTAIEHTPDLVVGAISNGDILESVRLAKHYGYSVAVQATGHGALEPIQSGVLISTRRLDQVSIDGDTCTATIAAGAKWKTVIAEADRYGLTPIAGTSVDLGVVGYILGGVLDRLLVAMGSAPTI